MSYVPNNLDVFTAAYSGAVAGFGAGARGLKSSNPTDYSGVVDPSLAFAEAFDTLWGDSVANSYQIEAIFLGSQGYFAGKSPGSLYSSAYSVASNAIIALVEQGLTLLTSKGITPNPWNSGGTGGSDFGYKVTAVDYVTVSENEFVEVTANGVVVTIGGPFNAVTVKDGTGSPTPTIPIVYSLLGRNLEDPNNLGNASLYAATVYLKTPGGAVSFRYNGTIYAVSGTT